MIKKFNRQTSLKMLKIFLVVKGAGVGHSNINMTMKYADTEESQVRDASRLLPF